MAPPGRPRREPNPLFARWLREWRDESAGTPRGGAYARALQALGLFPLPLPSGSAAAVLRGFGPTICARLDRRLRQHRQRLGLPPTPPRGRGGRGTRSPQPSTTALLLALSQSPRPLPRAELLQLLGAASQAALDSLVRQQLVQRSGHPPQFSLTPRGRALALRLATPPPAEATPPPDEATPHVTEAPPPPAKPTGPLPEATPPFAEATPPPAEATPPALEPPVLFELHPGEFDIVLCVDTAEGTLWPLLSSGPLPAVQRRLPVGDFVWVARETSPAPGRPPRELLLDVVVERKAAADLGQSLRDGRYREQKFRLGRCGLRQVLFLLEAPGGAERLPLPLPSLRQAAANTQVQDGFGVHWTGGAQDSAAFLGVLGGRLRQRYKGRVLRAWGGDVRSRGPPEPPGTPCSLLPFESLRGGGKNQPQRVGDVWLRQLLQVGGLGGGAAAALVGQFPTPASLLGALSCPSPPPLRGLRWGPRRRSLGPSLAAALTRLYGTAGPLP